MNTLAFVDEYGNNSFDVKTQGSHFIVASAICRDSELKDLEEGIDVIRKKYFQTGEMKSSGVGNNYQRRLLVLNDIAKLKFSIFAVVVDKRLLQGKGFEIKKSFYKYLNNQVYRELFRTYSKLELHIDEHGGKEYMLEFQRYVLKNYQPDLFSGSEFHIQNSKNKICIQLADFIAGTLGYIYDETKKSTFSKDFLNVLTPRIAGVNEFPRRYTFEELQESNIDETFDPKIAEVSLQRINSFLDNTKATDQVTKDQINFLNLLLLFQRSNTKNRYTSTNEIFAHIYHSREHKMSEEYFRSKVVGNLRDEGILIASSRDGYKIPTSSKDLHKFISHGKRIIIPMIHRIKAARDAVKLATGNDLDLLSLKEYVDLRRLLDVSN